MSESTEIMRQSPLAVMPVMNVAQMKARYDQFTDFVKSCLKEGVDYGVIPGSAKPSLLKPGAEKLNAFFGLTVKFRLLDSIEDWTGQDHEGEPFFYYRYGCGIYSGDHLIVESEASCNSWEVKYRYRQGERKCPQCGKATIIKGKEEYGGGWVCFTKKGGCNAKFFDGDQSIESQQIGRVANGDVCDLVNTLQKMGQKRGLIGSSLIATNASEYFTQDIEDMAHFGGSGPVANARPVDQTNGQGKAGEVGGVDALLLAYCVKLKSNPRSTAEANQRTGKAWFDAKYAKLSTADKEKAARELNLYAGPETEQPAQPETPASSAVVDSPAIEEETPTEAADNEREELLAKIEELRSASAEVNGDDKPFYDELERQMGSRTWTNKTTPELQSIVEGMTLYYKNLTKKTGKQKAK